MRRHDFRRTAVADDGLVIGFYLRTSDGAADQVAKPSAVSGAAEFKPNAFIRI